MVLTKAELTQEYHLLLNELENVNEQRDILQDKSADLTTSIGLVVYSLRNLENP